jgi:hypothetical protein
MIDAPKTKPDRGLGSVPKVRLATRPTIIISPDLMI